MYLIAIRVAFWLLVGHAVVAGANRKAVAAFAGVWVATYALAYVYGTFGVAAVIVHALLLVIVAIWLKIDGEL
jgi:hypothetical protein